MYCTHLIVAAVCCIHQQMCEVARLVCGQCFLEHSAEDTAMVVAVHVCTVCVSVFLIIVLYYSSSLALDVVHLSHDCST